jgi:hypothetical protein
MPESRFQSAADTVEGYLLSDTFKPTSEEVAAMCDLITFAKKMGDFAQLEALRGCSPDADEDDRESCAYEWGFSGALAMIVKAAQ